jgi:mannose-6-phosphate isomerase-like protein (cupin superfamily)
MSNQLIKRLPTALDVISPAGWDVRNLLGLAGGGMAHFELAPGQTTIAVAHHTVEELWFFLKGRGEMWRKLGDQEECVFVDAGVCIAIPVGMHFQFRSFGYEPLAALGVTMPPWTGDEEAYAVEGPWQATTDIPHRQKADSE